MQVGVRRIPFPYPAQPACDLILIRSWHSQALAQEVAQQGSGGGCQGILAESASFEPSATMMPPANRSIQALPLRYA